MSRILLSLGLLAGVAACAPTSTQGGFLIEVPEEVVALAAPNQDLTSVKLLPEDGCYWYRHVGPVETTMLPLMTTRGRHICTRSQDEATS